MTEEKGERFPILTSCNAMEVEGEAHGEENKELSEKKMRRQFKTPSQVQGLEEFYNEHKYPTESMKADLAEKLGLTEKQVSGWFCHRRLKDKRLSRDETYATARLDLSSGVIQDRGSGLRQDSCGSTKQGEHGIVDLREVESRRLLGKDPLAPGRNYEIKRHYALAGEDDTSSESDSDLPGNVHAHSRDLIDVKISQYATPSELISRSKGRMGPSGYLKIKSQTGNTAITAVKRQLGGHYKEDGPPLGVKFDPLPPGAFEVPTKSTFYESYSVAKPMSSDSVDLPVSHGHPTRYVMSSQGPFLEPIVVRPLTGFGKENCACNGPSRQKPYFPEHDYAFLKKKSPSVVDEYAIGETSVFDSNIRSSSKSKHGRVGVGTVALSDSRFHPSGGRIGSDRKEPVIHHYGDSNLNFVSGTECLDPKPSSLAVGCKDSFNSGARLPSNNKMMHHYGDVNFEVVPGREHLDPNPSRTVGNKAFKFVSGAKVLSDKNKMLEDEELYREIRTKRAHHGPIRACNIGGRGEAFQPGHIRKSPIQDHPTFPKLIKGPGAEMPSSCSEDETADTYSMD